MWSSVTLGTVSLQAAPTKDTLLTAEQTLGAPWLAVRIIISSGFYPQGGIRFVRARLSPLPLLFPLPFSGNSPGARSPRLPGAGPLPASTPQKVIEHVRLLCNQHVETLRKGQTIISLEF